MSTTLFAAISIFNPVQALVRRVCTRLRSQKAAAPAAGSPQELAQVLHKARPASPAGVVRHRPSRRIAPTLRVLRVAEAGPSSFHGGRMVISGRMADVCAELDRLAAQEAALQVGA